MRITIKTIAEKINISNQAVSAVLNGKTNCRVSQEKRELILNTAREMGYTSSVSAQIIRGKTTKTTAMLFSSPYAQNEEHLTRMAWKLMNRFNLAGYGCLYALARKNIDDNLKIVKDLISRGVTVFVFIGSPTGRNELEALIQSYKYTVVFYGTDAARRYVNSSFDDALKTIIDHFFARGYSRLQTLFGKARIFDLYKIFPDMTPEEVNRRYVCENQMLKIWNQGLDELIAVGYQGTAGLLSEKPDTQAIFYHSDALALGGAQYLIEHGYRIGEDILIAGINNTVAIRNHAFPISSVEHDIARITDCIFEEVFREDECRIVIPAKAHIRDRIDYTKYILDQGEKSTTGNNEN